MNEHDASCGESTAPAGGRRVITDAQRQHAAELIERAERAFGSGDRPQAAHLLLAAVEADPRSARGWNDLGVLMHGIGQRPDAEIALRNAVRMAPDDETYRANLEMVVTGAAGTSPWPLATQASTRVLAWPDYRSDDELDRLMDEFGGLLAAEGDVCLCLRHDPAADGPRDDVVDALQRAHQRTLGDGSPLEVLIVDDPMERDDWSRLGRAVQAVVTLESSQRQPRMSFAEAVEVPRVTSAEQLRARLGELAEAAAG